MIAAAYGDVSDIEIFWTLLAVVGLAFSVYTYRQAKLDRNYLIEKGIFNGRRKVSKYSLAAEATRAAKQIIYLLIGLGAMLTPEIPTTNETLRIRILGDLVTWGLITASALTTFQSYLAFRLRRDFQRSDER